jgi:FMN phosphatase YigB (HAD superfamily)
VETVLPFKGLSEYLQWSVCSEDMEGKDKPNPAMYMEALRRAQFWHARMHVGAAPLQPNEVLHIGDSFAADFCGARAAGFLALHLDRSANPNVAVYNDWTSAPDFPAKSELSLSRVTVQSLLDVSDMLVKARSLQPKAH